ncbi:MAG: aspartate kinase [Burkholderiaceae bacterium]|jgi:aspartokinase-like uncharacterized kinase
MWVVKIGGSLAHAATLQSWLGVLACYGGGRVVIVPGGGPFANQVRRAQDTWSFNDMVAHRMALLAMEQYGLMMTGIRADLSPAQSLEALRDVLGGGGVAVWLPWDMAENNPEIPQSWNMTSDSLAAWLSEKLKAETLFLVKSVHADEDEVSAARLSERGWVDRMFPVMTSRASYSTRMISAQDSPMMERMLLTGMTAGTLVTTGLPGLIGSEVGRRSGGESV